MKKETRNNLQCDWEGVFAFQDSECSVCGCPPRREIIEMAVEEIDAYRDQPWWRRLLNKMPEWEPFNEF
ncbi:MAG: hypothetical protein AABY22_06660 [Nanoarchaeota archaeon]